MCKDGGIRLPCESDELGFRFILYRPQLQSDIPGVTLDVTLNGTEMAVLAVRKQKPDSSRGEIADRISKTVKSVQRALDSLRDKEYIRRIGSRQEPGMRPEREKERGTLKVWYCAADNTLPVITAKDQVNSAHRECHLQLPRTAIVFFMSKCTDYIHENYPAEELPEPFPRFLNRCPIWEVSEYQLCFLDGGRGAPQACDTVETLAALGVKNILAVGMFGAFDSRVKLGEIITPEKVFIEEGTSLHYYESIDYSQPDNGLLQICSSALQAKTYPIVSTDAVYRQTFFKEQFWRKKGAVGVDMETSVVFSVSRYLGLRAAAILMASDIHPTSPDEPKWEWNMTKDMRFDLAEKSLNIAKQLH